MAAASSLTGGEAVRPSGQLFTIDQRANIWDFLFKDSSYLHMVAGLNYSAPYCKISPPLSTVLGYDLVPYYSGLQLPSYLALLISDWGGDALYERGRLFKSFRDQDYDFDEEACEVRFNKSGLVLHVGDAFKCEEWIRMRDPSRLFQYHQGELQTAALYYHDDSPCRLGPGQISGIEDFTGKEHIRYLCGVRLKFGNGKPVYRVIEAYDIPFKLVSKQIRDENSEWVVGWRLARAGEREWSFV